MLNSIHSNARSPIVRKMIIQASLNVLSIFIENRQFQYSQKLIRCLEESNIHEYDMYEKLTLVYQKSRFQYIQGDDAAINIMKKCKEIFEFSECYSTAQMIEAEIQELPSRKNSESIWKTHE